MTRIRTLAAAFALSLAASCTEYDFAEQDVAIGFDAETDVLVISLDTRGIYGAAMGSSETEATIDERAAARVKQMADGYRYFHVLTWPLVFDLDKKDEDSPAEAPDADPEFARLMDDLHKLAAGVEVTESRMYFDVNDEVAVFQRLRIEHATALFEALNESISISLVESIHTNAAGAAGETGDGIFESPEATRLLLDHAKAGRPWFTLDEQAISMHVPMTPQDLAKMLLQSFDLAADEPVEAAEAANMGRAFFHDLDGISVDGKVVTFRFPFGADGRIDMPLRKERHAGALRLRAQF